MKGDFSTFPFDDADRYSGVLHQQGRVLLDRDWNEQRDIDARWQRTAAADAFGARVMAVPSTEGDAFKVMAAKFDGSSVRVEIAPGRGWADGLLLRNPSTLTMSARYVDPPLAPATGFDTLAAGVRDAVLLEVWEDTVSAFQDPADLIEPALGGPDTTARTKTFFSARLLRLGPNDDCRAVQGLVDDFGAKGRLTVSPAPVLAVGGDCPLEAGGGYTGLEHYLYRIEIAEPAGGQARFKWSQFNGGLVGRGLFTPGALPATGTVDVLSNVQPIDHSGLDAFYLEALSFDAALGAWQVVFTADATRSGDGQLALANVQGTWPSAAPSTGFFRLWNGIARIADFPAGTPTELKDGIRLEFDAATATNYRPGDWWAFPVRASGAAFEPPVWPASAPPDGTPRHRVALAEITWNAALSVSFEDGGIEDCRRIFRPLTNQKICCTYNVGDGVTSFGDFNRIEDALRHLPAAGGEICLLPGLHATRSVIQGRTRITVRGCGAQTKVTPREENTTAPIFEIVDSSEIELLAMDLFTMGGTAIEIAGSKPGATSEILVADNRMLACLNAVRARNVAGLVVRDNRIRMLDKVDSGVGLYLAGDDSRIERNDLRLMPFTEMPPIDVPDRPNDPIDPTDPCAKIEIAFANPKIFRAYVDTVWAIPLLQFPLFTIETPPYRALGGIQVAGGSERVQVLDNTIVGGAGNGITLGASGAVVTPPPAPTFELTDEKARVSGTVLNPDGKPAADVVVALTPQSGGSTPDPQLSDANGKFTFGIPGGTYAVSVNATGRQIAGIEAARLQTGAWSLQVQLEDIPAPQTADDGFLYDITIERNAVSAMGLSGIGVPRAAPVTPATRGSVAAAQAQIGSPVIGLTIRANLLSANLRNPFDNALRQEATVRGLGGISLGMVDDVRIVDNRIDQHGTSALNPTCGIFIQYGEDVEIQRNQVVDNGSLPNGTTRDQTLVPGFRGGIVMAMATSLGNLALLRGGTATVGSRPAARIADNTVVQPVGCALACTVVGPLFVHDNALASEFAGPTPFEHAGGTVLIFNLGGVQTTGAGIDIRRPGSLAAADTAATVPQSSLGLNSRARLQPATVAVTRAAAAATLLPDGTTLFSDNQSRTGAAHTATGCQLITSFDDIGYEGNQSTSVQETPVFANTVLLAPTVRAIGNRWKERHLQSTMSAFTIALTANNTSFNQGDHCITVVDQNPGMPEIQSGNQVMFPSETCRSVGMTATLLLKPQG